MAQQKGRDTKQKLYRNFGMVKPEGYRKAMRIMQLAAQVPTADPDAAGYAGSVSGNRRRRAGAGRGDATNLREMARLGCPVIAICIGRAAAGTWLGVATRIHARYAVYSGSARRSARHHLPDSSKAALAASALG